MMRTLSIESIKSEDRNMWQVLQPELARSGVLRTTTRLDATTYDLERLAEGAQS